MESNLYDRISEYLSGLVITDTTTFYVSPAKDVQCPMCEMADTDTYFWQAWTGGAVAKFNAGANVLVRGLATGRCPHGAVPVLFGKQNDPDDWWDVSRVGKARIILTAHADVSTAASTDIIVQSAVKY